MPSHRRPWYRKRFHGGFAFVGVVVLTCLLGSCRKPAEPPPPPADGTYTLRGRLVNLPKSEGPDKYIKVHHERLPEFKNREGQVVGMPEMTMDFEQIAPEVPLAALKEGDVIEFTFEVRWKPRIISRVTMIRKLPADTKLEFEPQLPGGGG